MTVATPGLMTLANDSQPGGLVFAPIELIAFALGLLLMVPVLLDGFSNWLEGTQLRTAYLVLAAVLWAF